MKNLYCDNYVQCNSYVYCQGSMDRTEAKARARGWHIFHGFDHGGKQHNGVLCGHCADAKRRKLDPAPPLQRGQEELFEITAIVVYDKSEAP